MNFSKLCLPSEKLVEIFERIITTGKVTKNDQAAFLAAFASSTTPQEDLYLIDRLFWLTRLGKIKIACDASFPKIENLAHFPKPLKKVESYTLSNETIRWRIKQTRL